MAINMYDAFTSGTTIPVLYAEKLDGYYDEDNHWVTEGHKKAIPLPMTVLPSGNRDTGSSGKELKAKTTGERIPQHAHFTTVHELTINSLVTVYGDTFKLIRNMPYKGYGFFKYVGEQVMAETR